jgi:hypothetical protein
MKRLLLSWLLHHANRHTKSESFYAIKDQILSKYGKHIGYDVQHIPGKKCNSCGGKGQHPKYSNRPPYNIYDWADCYRCWGGWYKFPKWICLARIQFGRYVFHKPLKREERVTNPFTTDEIGWTVTDRPVIKGYIEHTKTWFSYPAFLIMFWLYNRPMFAVLWQQYKQDLRYRWHWKKRRIKERFTWQGIVIEKPKRFPTMWYDAKGQGHEIDPDLPF